MLWVPGEPQLGQGVLLAAPFVQAIGAALAGMGKAEEEPKQGIQARQNQEKKSVFALGSLCDPRALPSTGCGTKKDTQCLGIVPLSPVLGSGCQGSCTNGLP